ncbi:unnamed protein product [Linum trigynum]|uniref:Uncharacterized protein n=1 Tax=Linum trigynum TaxID=586398 RepID=A0AAV2DY85_9ROSI
MGAIRATKRAKVNFEIRGYKDELEFGVASMQDAHILLGRPWKIDLGVFHYGGTNQHKVRHKWKQYMLKSLSPEEVREDRRHLESNQRRSKDEYSGGSFEEPRGSNVVFQKLMLTGHKRERERGRLVDDSPATHRRSKAGESVDSSERLVKSQT